MAALGEEGLRLIPRLKPDLVIMDVMMPLCNGYEACRRIKADPATASIPVIMVSMVDDIRRLTLRPLACPEACSCRT